MKLITKIFAKLRAISFYPLQFKSYGTRTLILRPLALDGKKNIELGTHVIVQEQSWLAAVPLTGQTPNLIIGDDCVIGHLNLLRQTKAQCDYLIVGVSTDDLVSYKHKHAVIPFEERKEIVGAIQYVDEVVTQENMNKMEAWEKYHFNVMFVGDDWKGTDNWNKIEADLNAVGAKVVYFPYTKGTSSTLINETLHKLRNE